MANIVFFSIPAHGHVNPTIEVVRELTARGHQVRYYAFEMLRTPIESAGAEFVPCDRYLPPTPTDLARRTRYDFSSLIGMATHVTLEMEAFVCQDLADWRPDCMVADSMCIWGKLYARRLGIPMICSTTTFAFNDQTAKLMKPGLLELAYTIMGIPKINRYLAQLNARGFAVKQIQELISNDAKTQTIVYTSRAFQPRGESFGKNYTFVGPSVAPTPSHDTEGLPTGDDRPLVYVSLGTVIQNAGLLKRCVEALENSPYRVILSAGSEAMVEALGPVPVHITVCSRVPQLQILSRASVFITHCGMNSVNESILSRVPMVLVPQTSEQSAVANRAQEVGAGILLKRHTSAEIRSAVEAIITQKEGFQRNLQPLEESFRTAGGSKLAADKVEQFALFHRKQNEQ